MYSSVYKVLEIRGTWLKVFYEQSNGTETAYLPCTVWWAINLINIKFYTEKCVIHLPRVSNIGLYFRWVVHNVNQKIGYLTSKLVLAFVCETWARWNWISYISFLLKKLSNCPLHRACSLKFVVPLKEGMKINVWMISYHRGLWSG